MTLAENALGQEIHHLGLTFPTKWSARVRHKLEGVTRALQADLEAERKPFRVTILPPSIDEANAVAINLIMLFVYFGNAGLNIANPYFAAREPGARGRIVANAACLSPVLSAMRSGLVARVEEITRCLPEVQDALVSILSDRRMSVPELSGTDAAQVAAAPGLG